MRTLFVIAAAAMLAGCGVEVASTAATSAAIKKQELEQGKKSMEQAQQKIQQTMEQVQARSPSSENDPDKK